MKIETDSPKETADLGFQMAKSAKGSDIFALVGDLGGGKTCFTKGFARGLGIRRPVASPSFILMKIYKLKKGKIKKFCHVDTYRLKRPGEIIEVGLNEYLGRKDTITIVEWADKIKKILSLHRKTVLKFSFVNKNVRKILIKKT